MQSCALAGITVFAVHARKAWLSGLSPKENREVPPLDYGLVYALKRARPDLTIFVNGGIASLDEARMHLQHVDGVMIGRAAYQNPGMLAAVDRNFLGEPLRDVNAAVEAYIEYAGRELTKGVPLNALTKHMLGLFHGQAGARLYRRHLSENATKRSANLSVLRDALGFIGNPRVEAA